MNNPCPGCGRTEEMFLNHTGGFWVCYRCEAQWTVEQVTQVHLAEMTNGKEASR